MPNNERFMAIGLAMVDEKIRKPGLVLPPAESLTSFVDLQSDVVRQIGGVTPNIVSTLTKFDSNRGIKLFACTGTDKRGRYYRSGTSPNLGELQRSSDVQTGIVVSAIDDEGVVYQRARYLGAAEKIVVEKKDLETTGSLFISDITTLRLPNLFEKADIVMNSMPKGKLFLNLAGLNPAIAKREEIISLLADLKKGPDIVTGNESEFAYLMDKEDGDNTFLDAFPEARLIVMTQAEKGSWVRFEDEIFHVQPHIVPQAHVMDETGAGDTYAGILLGALYTVPYEKWTKKQVNQACDLASLGASMAVKTLRTRLTNEEMDSVKVYHRANL